MHSSKNILSHPCPEVKSVVHGQPRQNPKPHTRFRPQTGVRPIPIRRGRNGASDNTHTLGVQFICLFDLFPQRSRTWHHTRPVRCMLNLFDGQNPCVTPSAVGLTTTTENRLWQAPNFNQQRDRKTQQQQPSAPTEMPRARPTLAPTLTPTVKSMPAATRPSGVRTTIPVPRIDTPAIAIVDASAPRCSNGAGPAWSPSWPPSRPN